MLKAYSCQKILHDSLTREEILGQRSDTKVTCVIVYIASPRNPEVDILLPAGFNIQFLPAR